MRSLNQPFKRFVLVTSLLLTGCVSTQSSNFKDISAAYREVAEQYANDNILLNIVRASKDMPMSFLDIPSIVGSGSFTGNVAFSPSATLMNGQSPFDPLGRNLSATTAVYGGTLGMSVNNTFTFTQSSLDNARFMGKFMEDVPPETIRFYGSQKNLPRAAMLLLLIDDIGIRTIDNEEVARWTNDPRSADYEDFQKFLGVLLDVGLTVEPHIEKEPYGPPISEKQMAVHYSELLKDNSNAANRRLEKITLHGAPYYQLYKTKTMTRFCINKYKAESLFGNKIGKASYCTDATKPRVKVMPTPESEFLAGLLKERNPENKELVLRIKLRSTANIFDFLGNALIAQYQNPSRVVMVTSKDLSTFKPNYDDVPVTMPLFKVYKNGDSGAAISKVTYNGDIYYIKDGDQSYTQSVFEFLSTMLTLSKQLDALPPAPTIMVQ